VETITNLGATRYEVPAVQHHDPDLFLYREILRPCVRPASLIAAANQQQGGADVAEKERSVQAA
jgi:hypothetical protein